MHCIAVANRSAWCVRSDMIAPGASVGISDIIAGGPRVAPRGKLPIRPPTTIREYCFEPDKMSTQKIYSKVLKSLVHIYKADFCVSGIARRK